MALIKYGDGLDELRGSYVGAVYTTGNTCTVARVKLIKVGHASRLQVKNQAHWSYLTDAWIRHLNDQMRKNWKSYQAGTTWTNRLGQQIRLSGLNCFLRVNALRLAYNLPPRWDSPSAFGHAGDAPFTFTADYASDMISIDQPAGTWHGGVLDEVLFIAQGFPAHVGNVGLPSRFRGLTCIQGDIANPPQFPWVVKAKWTLNAGQRVTLRVMHQDEQYRIAGPWYEVAATD